MSFLLFPLSIPFYLSDLPRTGHRVQSSKISLRKSAQTVSKDPVGVHDQKETNSDSLRYTAFVTSTKNPDKEYSVRVKIKNDPDKKVGGLS